MTCDIAHVYSFGVENPLTPSAGATFVAEAPLPPAFNRDALKPSAPYGRRRAPMFAAQGSPYRGAILTRRSAAVRDLGLGVAEDGGNTSQDPTPSMSASFTEAVLEPDEFDKDILTPAQPVGVDTDISVNRRRDGKAAYRGIAPRKHRRGRLTRSSAADGASGIAPVFDPSGIMPTGATQSVGGEPLTQQGKPSLEDISEAAGQLSAVAADSDLRDRLDEIKSQAVALAVKLRTSPSEFVPGMPLERSWQLLADSVMGAASEIGAADPAALQATLASPAERPRPAAAEDISSLRLALDNDIPGDDGETQILLRNATIWLKKQDGISGSKRGSITLKDLDTIYRTHIRRSGLTDMNVRLHAFQQFNRAYDGLTKKRQKPVAIALGRAARGGINFLKESGPP